MPGVLVLLLAQLLAVSELRFRCAVVHDGERRARVARALGDTSGHPATYRPTLLFYDVDDWTPRPVSG